MITQDNILSHELIGMTAKVIESTNKQVIGLNGTIVDETKSMLTINTKSGMKNIPKQKTFWSFQTENSEFTVNGDMIVKKPQDRLGVRK